MLARERTDIRAVCMSGGVFHHRLLTGILFKRLRELEMETYLPVRVSPGMADSVMVRLWSRLRGLPRERAVKRQACVWKYTRKVVRCVFGRHLQRCERCG
jgi:hypothetical protein